MITILNRLYSTLTHFSLFFSYFIKRLILIWKYKTILLEDFSLYHALRRGDNEFAKYLIVELGVKPTIYCYDFYAAAEYGDLDMMKWLYKMGFQIDKKTFESAVYNGNIDNLKWLHEVNCPKSNYSFRIAVEEKNLEVAKWLYQNGCFDDNQVLEIATKNNNYAMMRWLYEIGCRCDFDKLSLEEEMKEWIRDNLK